MSLTRFSVRIEGVTPLLQNRMSEDQLLAIWSKTKRQTTQQSRPETPREDAAKKVYTLEDGTPYLPGVNLMSCLIAAGVFMKLDGKRQISTKDSSVLGGMLALEQQVLPLQTPGWEVDIRQGRNPNGGEAVCIVRPRFDKWALEMSALLDLDQLPETRFRELFDIAGTRVGLCDFRPARKGTYGRWTVTNWQRESGFGTAAAAE